MDESADARILIVVTQRNWKMPTGRPHASWLAIMKNDLSSHNLSVEDATELALDSPPWRLLTVWQQVELWNEMVQAEQWWWWWWWWWYSML